MIRFYKVSKKVLTLYVIGLTLVLGSIGLKWYLPGFLTQQRFQQLLIAGAILVTIGSIINTITYIRSEFGKKSPSKHDTLL